MTKVDVVTSSDVVSLEVEEGYLKVVDSSSGNLVVMNYKDDSNSEASHVRTIAVFKDWRYWIYK